LDYILTGFMKLPIRADGPEAIPLHVTKMTADFLYLKSGKNDIIQLEEIVNACYVSLGRLLSNRDASPLIHSKASIEFFGFYSKLRLILPYTYITNIADKLTDIRDLEKSIDSSGMSTDEKRIAYWVCSTARFSMAYWLNEFDQEKSLWISTAALIGGWEDLPVKLSSGPPQWVYDDIEAALVGAFFTANPFVALGGGVATSAVAELKRYGASSGWW